MATRSELQQGSRNRIWGTPVPKEIRDTQISAQEWNNKRSPLPNLKSYTMKKRSLWMRTASFGLQICSYLNSIRTLCRVQRQPLRLTRFLGGVSHSHRKGPKGLQAP